MKKIKVILIYGILISTLIGCQQNNALYGSQSSQIETNTNEVDTEIIDPISQSSSITESIPFVKLEPTTTLTSENKKPNTSGPVPEIDHPISIDGQTPIAPFDYQKALGKGMDVDWSKTSQGRQYYNEQTVIDFKNAGISHVRIRVKDKADDALFDSLDRQIDDCLRHGLIPVIAYQADEFKNDPSQKNIDKVVSWWGKVAERYQSKSYLLSFDLLIEATDALNKQPEKLNEIYEQLVAEIRKTNPTRIIMMSPRLRSDAAYLSELTVPTKYNNYMMAEWHFYASGPSKTNDRKLWTTGTKEEQDKITEKINLALEWQKSTGIPTWVGAWMPGNYNDENDYTIEEQEAFAKFMTNSLSEANIPFAVNSDTKFYDRASNQWIQTMQPVFNAIYK